MRSAKIGGSERKCDRYCYFAGGVVMRWLEEVVFFCDTNLPSVTASDSLETWLYALASGSSTKFNCYRDSSMAPRCGCYAGDVTVNKRSSSVTE